MFSQSVMLAWDPSPAPDIVGYHVYYGIGSQTYTNFVVLGSQTTSTTISNLTAGLIYYFAATTINSSGLESAFSAEVSCPVGTLACNIVVSSLVQAYDGTPKQISVSTTPANLPVIVTYGATLQSPIEIGLYPFTVVFSEGTCIGGVTGVLTIKPSKADITLENLTQVYDGNPKQPLVTTAPAGLAVSVTYNGSTLAPSQAGTYRIAANVSDPTYAGSASAVMTIAPAQARISLGNLYQTYSGVPLAVSASTTPPALPLLLTYDGLTNWPIDSGIYSVSANVQDPNYVAGTNALFIIAQSNARVQLTNLDQLYDGAPKAPDIITTPAGLDVFLSYNGQQQPPTAAGSYLVAASVADMNYFGSATGLLTISKAPKPSDPVVPTDSGGADCTATPTPLLRLFWPTNTGTLTIWESTDLKSWTMLTNLDGTVGSAPIASQGEQNFLRATTLTLDGTVDIPLSIGRP